MATRHDDWLRQAKRDLEMARVSSRDGFHEWACFAAQQSAEKALKAVFQRLGADAWGHVLADLVAALAADLPEAAELDQAARELDRHYIAPRYPDSMPRGAPGDSYTQNEAERAIDNAEQIFRFCESHILR